MSVEALLTIEEFAARVGVHPRTVRRWIKDGGLRVKRFGYRTVRITEREASAFISAH